MNKRVLSLLLVVAMLASLVVFPVNAATTCPCGCNVALDQVEWKTWTGANEPVSGHYKLENDLVTAAHINIGSTKGKEATIVLDLNGHVWRCENDYLMGINAGTDAKITMHIVDTAGGGELQATGANNTAAVVSVLSGGTFYLHGGTLRQLYSETVTPALGVLYVSSGTAYMTGGKITDGYTTSNGSATNGVYGGNVVLRGSAVLHMSAGEITNGYSLNGGAGVLINGTLNMTGGTISGNITEEGNGGNILVASSGKLNISGGAIVENGVAGNRGGNIYNNGTATLDGVTGIDGDIYAATNMTLKGTVKIPMGNSNGILLSSGKTLDVSAMKDDSEVFFGVNTSGVEKVFTTGGGAELIECFKNVGRTAAPAVASTSTTELSVNTPGDNSVWVTSYCPHCGEDAEPVTWANSSSLTGANQATNLATYDHFFCNNTTAFYGSKLTTVSTTANANGTFVLDLYSKEHTATVGVAVAKGATLALLDTAGGGSITSTSAGNGAIANTSAASSKIEIYSGTFTGTALRGGAVYLTDGTVNFKGGILKDCEATKEGVNGGAICANAPAASVNVSGGLITGGKCDGRGGSVYANGALSITGGIMQKGESQYNGGNVGINSSNAVIDISNAVIRGGKTTMKSPNGNANGGNIGSNTVNTFTITNCTIAGGTSTNDGGNIGSSQSSPITIKNSFIYGGSAINGGSIYASANLTLENSIISGGTATTHGGNIYLNGGYTIDVDNCSISNGTAVGTATEETTTETNTGCGGNIYSNNASAKLLMDNTVVSNGSAATEKMNIGRGGNIYFNNGTATLTDCIFNGGEAYYGGSIYCASNLTLTNVTVNGGHATGAGGGVYHNRAANVAFNNVTVNGATTDGSGGNMRFRAAATVTEFKNVTLINGSAATNGGNLSVETAATIPVEGLTATGGSAGEHGGNIYLTEGAKVDLTDCTISDGVAKKDGGNLFVANTATGTDGGAVLLTNCTFENGHAFAETAERHESSDNIYAASDIVLDGVQVSGNSGQNELGSGVYATAKVTLKNNTVVGSENDPISGSLYLKNATSSLEVDESFSGTVVLSPYWLFLTETTDEETGETTTTTNMAGGGFSPYGQTLSTATTTGIFTGKLYMGDHKTSKNVIWEYGMPAITLVDGELVVDEGGAIVKNASGAQHYTNIAAAVEAYEAGNVLKLVAANPSVALTGGEYYIDVNGKNATVNGTGIVYGIDTTNDDHDGTGSLVAGEGVTVKAAATDPLTGEVYIKTLDTGNSQFHHISMDITKVVLRTANAGVYYKGEWACDKTLALYLQEQGNVYAEGSKLPNAVFGVVASIDNMPENGFNDDVDDNGDNLNCWSYNSGAAFTSGAVANGALVTGILLDTKDPAYNAEDCNTKIYAKAYLMVTEDDGTQTYVVGKTGADKSLMDMFVKIDTSLKNSTGDLTSQGNVATLMNSFYNTWKDLGLQTAIDAEAAKEGGHTFTQIFQTVAAEEA